MATSNEEYEEEEEHQKSNKRVMALYAQLGRPTSEWQTGYLLLNPKNVHQLGSVIVFHTAKL